MKAERGFTLLEVMVALAVFALLVTAVLSACQFVLQQNAALRERLFASWLADNHLAELRLQRPDLGRQRVTRAFGGQQWTIEQRVERDPGGRFLNVALDVRGADGTIALQSQAWIVLALETTFP